MSLPRTPGYSAVTVTPPSPRAADAAAAPAASGRYNRTFVGPPVLPVPLNISRRNRACSVVMPQPIAPVVSAPASTAIISPAGPQLSARQIAAVPRLPRVRA